MAVVKPEAAEQQVLWVRNNMALSYFVDRLRLCIRNLRYTTKRHEFGLKQWFIQCYYGICPHSGIPEEEEERFWNKLFHLASCIPQNEIDVLAGDIYGHVGSSNVGYDGTHNGSW